MSMEFEAIWKDFDAAFGKVLAISKSPWEKSVSEKKLDAFENKTGLQFPEDLKKYLTLCGGSDDQYLCPPWYLITFENLTQNWNTMMELQDSFEGETAEDTATGIKKDLWYRPAWIPIAHNFSGDFHCVDLDPDTGGTHGQIISFFHDRDERRILATSIADYFAAITREIKNGNLFAKDRYKRPNLTCKEGTEAARIFAW